MAHSEPGTRAWFNLNLPVRDLPGGIKTALSERRRQETAREPVIRFAGASPSLLPAPRPIIPSL